MAPRFIDSATVADLFSVNSHLISKLNKVSTPTTPLKPDQPLLVPLSCSCNEINSTFSIFYANVTYKIKEGDTFYYVSTEEFQNLTTYQSVEVVNPTLIPTDLQIGQDVIFPIFCKCPDLSLLQNQVNYLISYVFQPSDNLSIVASRFGVETQSIVDINGINIQTFETIFIPLSRLPRLTVQTADVRPSPSRMNWAKDHRGHYLIVGLEIGIGTTCLLLFLVICVWVYREDNWLKRQKVRDEEQKMPKFKGKVKRLKNMKASLLADLSNCLDKYRVFKLDEIKIATDGFSENCLIQGSVYKGSINWEVFAIKKMKWNANEDLRILQKVNHGNLVQLEGLCMDPENANFYLIYEYVENGSLHSWLHDHKTEKLDWKTRLSIAVDVANGLQYIHEHTRPKIVHKDMRSSNILLDSKMRAKIANFGLAKPGLTAMTKHTFSAQGYIAPECISEGQVTTKMDVFAFGVLLLELVSGEEVIDEEGKCLWAKVSGILEGKEETMVRRLKAFMDEVLVSDESSCPIQSVINVMSVAIACLHQDFTKRPTMVEVVYALSRSGGLSIDMSQEGSVSPKVAGR
ncbi:hypothetical protein K2173_006464 [Erythroxylum novogranatense]|uniref:Protein kinase domain-containing protein n=1 Tax=Erythroxylum novogranatense TaxID=1862640 RepID=A0AAV8TCJ2_9ROSI|nr:hypothetical protein K2173_006464 [Erythroxylum novogranatense]